MIMLKNGAEEVAPLVNVVMHVLRNLWNEKPMVAYDFIMICRDRNYKPFGSIIVLLLETNMVQFDGESCSVHDSVKNIVLSAVTGEGIDMVLGSPVKEI